MSERCRVRGPIVCGRVPPCLVFLKCDVMARPHDDPFVGYYGRCLLSCYVFGRGFEGGRVSAQVTYRVVRIVLRSMVACNGLGWVVCDRSRPSEH